MQSFYQLLRPSPDALLNLRRDVSFKALFTQETPESKAALADLISAMLDRKVKEVELTANEPPVDVLDEMQMSFDVGVVFADGERASIEMQCRDREYEWTSRAEIQAARLLNVAAKKGSNWESPKTYQMSVLDLICMSMTALRSGGILCVKKAAKSFPGF